MLVNSRGTLEVVEWKCFELFIDPVWLLLSLVYFSASPEVQVEVENVICGCYCM